MNPILVLKCKGSYDSFKFEDRQVQLDSGGAPVKVGRSQGALKPRGDNSIFECRVLSRSHAQVWCEEGVFFIKVSFELSNFIAPSLNEFSQNIVFIFHAFIIYAA